MIPVVAVVAIVAVTAVVAAVALLLVVVGGGGGAEGVVVVVVVVSSSSQAQSPTRIPRNFNRQKLQTLLASEVPKIIARLQTSTQAFGQRIR